MGQVQAFCGAAGTGKTYNLVAAIKDAAAQRCWQEWEGILGLTFMHGARRRLGARLRGNDLKHVRVSCQTIDSFCLWTVNRFRRTIGKSLPILAAPDRRDLEWEQVGNTWRGSFDLIRQAVVQLLSCEQVGRCVTAAFPLVVVDEFQDCTGDLLRIIQLLSGSSQVFAAADAFQHLNSSSSCPAVEWLGAHSLVTTLDAVRRTTNSTLLSTARAIRDGLPANPCIEVLPPDGPGLAAWEIAAKLAWKWSSPSTVIISAVRPETSRWVQRIMSTLEKELGRRQRIGPFPFAWESAEDRMLAGLVELLPKPEGGDGLIDRDRLRDGGASSDSVVREVCAAAIRLLSIRGEGFMTADELLDIAGRRVHVHIAFGESRTHRRVAMTIHGAKNREFDYVFVLWPYEISGDHLHQRKLLYNAITRAKKNATLIVQGGPKRLDQDPVLALLKAGFTPKRYKGLQRKPRKRA